MRRRSFLAALAALASAATPAWSQQPDPPASPDMTALLAARIAANQGRMGISAARLENGAAQFASAGRLKAGETPVPDQDTLYEIGSISKVFTALLLAQMVLEGRMDLDVPVRQYLPEGTILPQFEGREITPFDLATHYSGLPPIPDDLEVADPANPYARYSAQQLLAFLARHQLSAAPGTGFVYSNTGAALLGLALANSASASHADLVRTRILDPLEMADTMLRVPRADTARFASPHDINGDPISPWDFDVFAAAGGYRSSAKDLAKFIAAAGGQVETPLADAFALMLARTRPAGNPGVSIGLGWMISETPDGQIVWHNGITGGSNSFIGYRRDGKRGAVVLANRLTPTGIEDLGFHLIDERLPLQPGRGIAVAAIDASIYPDYVGNYAVTPDSVLGVTSRDNRLFVKASGQPDYEVLPEGKDRFFYTVVDARITFERDASGAVTGLVLHQNGQDMRAPRVSR